MELRFPAPGTRDTLRMNVRFNAVSLSIGDAAVYSFDRAGRLVTAWMDDRTFRRGLDNRVLCRWHEPDAAEGSRRSCQLSQEEVRLLIERVQADAAKASAGLASSQMATALPVRRGGCASAEEFGECLNRIAGFDFAALERDAVRFASVYLPVTILPPDQYLALVLQATEGCRYNHCSFCSFYRNRPFRIKHAAEFRDHIAAVLRFFGDGITLRRSVFLADANSLCIPLKDLLPLLDAVNDSLPVRSAARSDGFLEGIDSFTDAFSEVSWRPEDYAELRARNVRRLYLGVESGCRDLLRFLRKPQTPQHVLSVITAIKSGGLAIGVILMLGIGGETYADRHVDESLTLLNSIPWSAGDLVFLSPFVEAPGQEYQAIASRAGILPMNARRMQEQYRAIKTGIRRNGRPAWPRIAPYRAEEFLY